MLIVVAASDEQWNEITGLRPAVDWQRVTDASSFYQYKNADVFFSLKDDNSQVDFKTLQKPVFIHSVAETLVDLGMPLNVYRINGWESFLKRSVWEVAGVVGDDIKSIFNLLGIQLEVVRDEPGFVSARIIAMIINEAYFAIEDDVSSKADIDIAMKLGTNYPHGPFEWAKLIGACNILLLLQKLQDSDVRYQPSSLLVKEVAENNL